MKLVKWFEQAALLNCILESTDLEVDEAGTITSVSVTIQDGGYSKLAKLL